MAKVVGLSGSQGGGKSSLLTCLSGHGWDVDDFKVSRAVQAEFGWESLSNVMDSPQTMVKFQREIHRQKVMRDEMLMNRTDVDVILTERTFADICAYSVDWGWKHADKKLWSLDDAVNWAQEITHMCAPAQKLYSGVILLPFMKDVIKWEEDPNRASFNDIERIYDSVEHFMRMRETFRIPKLIITAKSVDERAYQVNDFLRELDRQPDWKEQPLPIVQMP